MPFLTVVNQLDGCMSIEGPAYVLFKLSDKLRGAGFQMMVSRERDLPRLDSSQPDYGEIVCLRANKPRLTAVLNELETMGWAIASAVSPRSTTEKYLLQRPSGQVTHVKTETDSAAYAHPGGAE